MGCSWLFVVAAAVVVLFRFALSFAGLVVLFLVVLLLWVGGGGGVGRCTILFLFSFWTWFVCLLLWLFCCLFVDSRAFGYFVVCLFVCRFEGLSTGPSSLPTRDLFPFTILERSSFPTTVGAAPSLVSFECSVQMNYF